MENWKINFEITPLAVLALGGLFVITSIANEGQIIRESLWIFFYGIFASFVRQVYKDSTKKESSTWRWFSYYFIQLLLFVYVITQVL